jgi:hypothetical protein
MSFTVLETSTSLGRAAAAIRAPIWTVIPRTLALVCSISPVWTPSPPTLPPSARRGEARDVPTREMVVVSYLAE